MPKIGEERVVKSSLNRFALNGLIERLQETKELLARWVDEMDRVLKGSRASIDEFREALDTLADRVKEWRRVLGEAVDEGEKEEEEFLTSARRLNEGDTERREEIEEEKVSGSKRDMTGEEREDIKGYVLALKHSGWNQNKILETLSKREFYGRKFNWELLNEVTKEVFAQDRQ